MKVKIYISFYFVGLFFYLVTYWKKRQIFLVKQKRGTQKASCLKDVPHLKDFVLTLQGHNLKVSATLCYPSLN